MPPDNGAPLYWGKDRPAELCGGVMIRISLAYFYDLSLTLDKIRALQPGQNFNDAWFALGDVEFALQQLLTSTITSPAVRTARASALQLLNAVKAIVTAPYDEERSMKIYEVANLNRLLNSFETVLRAEFASADAYYVTPKRGYDTLCLVTRGDLIWPSDLGAKVPSAIADVREAAKCIAFELCTAAGFHIIRAVESVLLKYWTVVTNGKALPSNRNIGNYLNQLEKQGVGDPKIIAVLRQIKDLHRNELFHPEVSLTFEESIELLGIAQSAVSAMLKVIPVEERELIGPVDPAASAELHAS